MILRSKSNNALICLPLIFTINFGVKANIDEACSEEVDYCKAKMKLECHEFDHDAYINLDLNNEDGKEIQKWRFGLNLEKSIEIGVNRSIPDHRPKACLNKDYYRNSELPSASVLITFRDEPRSTLLRTIVSVLQRTNSKLLHEIILVDDNNDDFTVGNALKILNKVKVVRNEVRQGLIRSRLRAIEESSGEVLVFLDSHCEVEAGWLEPLLAVVHNSPSTIACPLINNINLDHFHFEPVSTFLRGGFNWHLDFFWEWLPPEASSKRRHSPDSNYKTPAMAGGLFAINKAFFEKLGLYDDKMEIWGSENIELSIRTWNCGGQIEIVPCSQVGHVYKQKNVYSFPQGVSETMRCNKRRVADVWLDEFVALFNITQSSKNSSNNKGERKEKDNKIEKLNKDTKKEDEEIGEEGGKECGDITDRLELRKRLKCKPFQWFITNVYPQLPVPLAGDVAFGSIHISGPGFLDCLDGVALGTEASIGANACLQVYAPQDFRMTNSGLIAQNDFCIALKTIRPASQVETEWCDSNVRRQLWRRVLPDPKKKKGKSKGLSGYMIRSRDYDLCLDASEIKTKGLLVLRCQGDAWSQRFAFDYNIESPMFTSQLESN